MKNENIDKKILFSLKEIADWQIKTGDIGFRAGLPSLQRGAVWEPHQIELLWDSILRGYPIGSIVLTKKEDQGQNIKESEISKKSHEITHFIIDGQQRCNAIAWGFANIFDKNPASLFDNFIVWIDLLPKESLENSSRKYLIRVTTKAHPWGYRIENRTQTISTSQINKFLGEQKDRPEIKEAYPHLSNFPVPLSLVLKHNKKGKLDIDLLLEEDIVKSIIKKKSIDNINKDIIKEYIESGLVHIEKYKVYANYIDDSTIEDIENLFVRLNKNGTDLNNEEMQYSMIKAYYPDIEFIISKIENIPTTEARLVNIGIRVALSIDFLHNGLKIDKIRNMFKNEDKNEDKDKIIKYFEKLNEKLQCLDKILCETKDNYIPKYLKSSIFWHSPEVCMWLLWMLENTTIKDKLTDNKIIGIALLIHWFGINKQKQKAVNLLMKDELKLSKLFKDDNKYYVIKPLEPEIIRDITQIDKDTIEAQLENWSGFWKGTIEFDKYGEPSNDKDEREKEYGEFLKKIAYDNRLKKEMLVYTQKEYIEDFKFDPSNKLLWKDYNRPWDYDHILPTNKLNAQGRGAKIGKYRDTCQAWQNSIGNLIAVDFSFNRSASDTIKASKKYGKDNDGFDKSEKLCGNIDLEEIKNYDLELSDTENFEKCKKFVLSAQNRTIKIYEKCYCELFKDIIQNDPI